MSEGTPRGQRENLDLSRLIQELELQIESVNEGLSKIRGTVARISYAASNSTSPASSGSWNGSPSVAPANRGEWHIPAVESRPVEELPPSRQPGVSQAFATHDLASTAEAPAEGGFSAWDASTEGASWPRSPGREDKRAPQPQVETPISNEWAWEPPPADAPSPPDASDSTAEAQTPEQAPATGDDTQSNTAAGPETTEELQEWNPGVAPEAAESTPTSGLQEATPGSLSGWPDESAWAQDFTWPSSRPRADEPVRDAADEGRIDVSDIVAQVKAELEAAQRGEIPLPSLDYGDESPEGEPASEAPVPEISEAYVQKDLPAENGADDEARRDEVSRAVAEMRRQIEAGEFDDIAPNSAAGAGTSYPDAGLSEHSGAASADEDIRADVRRAVEAAREEISPEESKPAFRLAAPGSIPDWSHMQLEPSGPPVVVMKDTDGRVELASVYETLHELGCGDGAALLNYTPHSVTVGLPGSAPFPSKEQMAAAVEKVFGLTSRVESDGVRITVSIGESPKRRSEDAA